MFKEIKERFIAESEKSPMLSSFVCFSRVMRKKSYPSRTVRSAFNNLVEKDDYASKDRETLLEWIIGLKTTSKNQTS